MERYHPALVAIHWLMAISIILGLILGNFLVGPLANEDLAKPGALTGHMGNGIFIGVLLVVRFILRMSTQKPPPATTGNPLLDQIGSLTHWVLYVLVAAMVLSGLGMAFGADLFAVVYGGNGTIPLDLSQRGPAMVHDFASNLLALLVSLHILAALYHQFMLGDGLFRRMWFRRRG